MTLRINHKLFLLLGIIAFTFSCKSSKSVTDEVVTLKSISDSKLIDNVEKGFLGFESYYVKKYNADVVFNGSRKSFSGTLYFENDSQMIISVAPLLGIELFRAKLGRDSVYLIDRTKKMVYYGSYDLVKKMVYLDLNFMLIDAIFSNSFFALDDIDGGKNAIKRYKNFVTDNRYVLTNSKHNRTSAQSKVSFVQSFSIEPENYKIILSDVILPNSKSGFSVKYDDMKNYKGKLFPNTIKINGFQGNNTFSFNLNFSSVEFNSKNSLKFSIPEKYSFKEVK